MLSRLFAALGRGRLFTLSDRLFVVLTRLFTVLGRLFAALGHLVMVLKCSFVVLNLFVFLCICSRCCLLLLLWSRSFVLGVRSFVRCVKGLCSRSWFVCLLC